MNNCFTLGETIDFGFSKTFKYSSLERDQNDSKNLLNSQKKIFTIKDTKYANSIYLTKAKRTQSVSKQLSPLKQTHIKLEQITTNGIAIAESPSDLKNQSMFIETIPGGMNLIAIHRRPLSQALSKKKMAKQELQDQYLNADIQSSLKGSSLMKSQAQKPPKARKINLEQTQVEQLQATINQLREKLRKYEQQGGNDLKEGTAKDLKYLADLSILSPAELKSFLVKYLHDIKELKSQYKNVGQKLKELMHDFQSGKELYFIRQKLSTFIDYKYDQLNFEQLYIEQKREAERSYLQIGQLNSKIQSFQNQLQLHNDHNKELKLKLKRQTQENSKQANTIITQNKVNSEKAFKVESLMQSVMTLTDEDEIWRTSKYKEQIVLKRTINFLLRENFELKKNTRVKDGSIDTLQNEINRLKTKVNRLMLRIEEDNKLNLNNDSKRKNPSFAIQGSSKPAIAKRQSNMDDNFLQSQITGGHNQTPHNHRSNMFDFEILSQAGQDSLRKPDSPISVSNDDPKTLMHSIINQYYVDQYDIEYRIKCLMPGSDQDLMEELQDGQKQKFIEVTMSSMPLIHKERVEFLANQFVSYMGFGEKLNLILKMVLEGVKNNSIKKLIKCVKDVMPKVFNCQRCTLWAKDPNKETRMSSVDDIVGYVLNNSLDILTSDLQKYITLYNNGTSFYESKFFEGQQRKSAILLPIKEPETGLGLGVLEIVNSNTGFFDYDAQYLAYLITQFSSFVINSLNHEIRRKKAEHARTQLNMYAIKIFGQRSLARLNNIACEALKEMLHIDKVKFCFVQESLIDLTDFELVIFNQQHENNSDKKEGREQITYSKQKIKDYFGIMGHVMQNKISTIIINPELDHRYNEIIDMKTQSPMYCFPIFDISKLGEKKVVGCVQFENKEMKILKSAQIQIQGSNNNETLLIDDQMRLLMLEFNNYIAETLKIIKNQKMLNKFKDFIVQAQENKFLSARNSMVETPKLAQSVSLKESINEEKNEEKDNIQEDQLRSDTQKQIVNPNINIPLLKEPSNKLKPPKVKINLGLALLKRMTAIEQMKNEIQSPKPKQLGKLIDKTYFEQDETIIVNTRNSAVGGSMQSKSLQYTERIPKNSHSKFKLSARHVSHEDQNEIEVHTEKLSI